MTNDLTQTDIDRIIAQARRERAGAFARMVSNLFRR